ncbi:MAG: sensor histidine kinase [Lutibacter sp.]
MDNDKEKLTDKIIELQFENRQLKSEIKQAKIEQNLEVNKLIHNLKNPIGVVLSFSEMMFENIENLPLEKRGKFLRAIQKSAQFSINFLTKIGEYNHFKNPDYKLDKQNCNIRNIILEVLEEQQKVAAPKNIEFVFSSEVDKGLLILADSEALKKAISEVISNAVRYSENHSKVIIKLEEEQDSIKISVCDEGIGVETENLDCIFNPFWVENTYSKNQEKCIGLGLAITKEITTLHDGKIDIVNNQKKGLTVSIYLKK